MPSFRIVAAGDSALLVELPPSIDPATSGRVLALARAIRERHAALIRDLAVGYCSLTVYFDPLAVDARVARVGNPSDGGRRLPKRRTSGRWLMCRSAMGVAGPDLRDVARAAGCSKRRSSRSMRTLYRVYWSALFRASRL